MSRGIFFAPFSKLFEKHSASFCGKSRDEALLPEDALFNCLRGGNAAPISRNAPAILLAAFSPRLLANFSIYRLQTAGG